MEFVLYLLTGALGGVLGGMGMGGGTVLIPLLTMLFSVGQHTAQAVNLTAFIPMACCALILHAKNGLVEYKSALWVICGALPFALIGSYIAKNIRAKILGKFFGGFLIILSIISLIISLSRQRKK